MREEYLVQPSLTVNSQRSETYSIDKLFYVAFFGGVVALTGLAVKNAKMLRMSQAVVIGMIAAAVIVFGVKLGFYYAVLEHLIEVENRVARYMARALEMVLCAGFYFSMKKSYQNHMLLVGGERPILKPALAWCGVSILIEGSLIMLIAM
ncbi:hypothetical protein [Paenibacillus turpanensis]|uniref:hypothetical protein n=1 Tax=Paenibacillus turpanensis TaxID=2689078 RepID=UPI00140A1DD2|nr:hypothetical protein [Paenibacillus turpanensis]